MLLPSSFTHVKTLFFLVKGKFFYQKNFSMKIINQVNQNLQTFFTRFGPDKNAISFLLTKQCKFSR